MEQITFGRHKGLSREKLLAEYPSYALWAHKNVAFFTLSPAEIQACLALSDNPWAGHGPRDYEDDHGPDEYGGMSYSDFGNN